MERAGRGASSVVFKARRKADGKVYCVKEIDMSAVVPEEEEQALREVQLLASFERRNSEKSTEKNHLLWMLDLTCSTQLTSEVRTFCWREVQLQLSKDTNRIRENFSRACLSH